jgi:putative membrane protein
MKTFSVAAALAGLAAMAVLVAVFGAEAVARSLLALGWAGFAAICGIQLALIAVMGVAWRGLAPERAAFWVFPWARLVRDAGSEVLPLSPVGGSVLGARAAMLAGVSGSIAAASTIADLTLELLAKLAYTALGLVWLVHLRPGSPFAWPVVLGLAAACVVTAGFVLAQRRGALVADWLAVRLGRGWAERTAAGAAALQASLERVYRLRGGLWRGFALHLACWIGGAGEAWIALQLIDAPLPVGSVLVVESLVYAVRTVAVVVPNAVGVQEGAYIVVGAAFGLSPQTALALSLIKRARDLAIGLPAIGVWQAVESGRFWRRAALRRKP